MTTPEALRQFVVDALGREDLAGHPFGPDTPLQAGGLGLDSVDLLDLVLALQARHGPGLLDGIDDLQPHLATVGTLLQLAGRAGAVASATP